MAESKCHINCKTCSEEGTDDNNKCLTCKDEGPKYLYYENCVTSCPNNKYFSDLNDSSILRCNCPNIKCLYCTYESLSYENNLCILCNTEENFYPKIKEQPIESYINCYKDLEGYYLDNNIFKPCYFSCKNCTGEGNITNNKCTKCNDGYEFKYDEESNNNNCYEKCNYYYYYDSENNYKCTNESVCPKEFSKLINETKRCVNNCTKYHLYEYNNNCISEPPSIPVTSEIEYPTDSTSTTDASDTEYPTDSTYTTDTSETEYPTDSTSTTDASDTEYPIDSTSTTDVTC